VGHLQVVILLTEQLYKMCGVFFDGIAGWVGGGTRSRCYNSGYHDPRDVMSELSLVAMYICQSRLLFFC